MKLLQISVHYEYSDAIEGMLDRHGVERYIRHAMVDGRDIDGKHFGSQVYPGNVTVYQAALPGEQVAGLLEELRGFRDAKRAHQHLWAVVTAIEEKL